MSEIPVKKGDIVQAEVIGFGDEKHPNRMISKYQNFVIIISDCKLEIGDIAEVEVTTVMNKYAFASLR